MSHSFVASPETLTLASRARARKPRLGVLGNSAAKKTIAVCNLFASILGCGPAEDSRVLVHHMQSYSLLEHVEEAEVESFPGTIADPRLITSGGVERPAIAAFAPCEIRFRSIPLYASARLSLGVGLSDAAVGAQADGVRFSVRLESSDLQPVEVWSRELDPQKPEDRRWMDVNVDLELFSGKVVDLVLVTEVRKNRAFDFSAWSLPVLQSAGEEIPLSQWLMPREVRSRMLQLSQPTQVVEIPEQALLEVVGELVRGSLSEEERIGPAEFIVRANGSPVFSRVLRTPGRAASFFDTVSLADLAGQTVELSLEVDGGEAETHSARWLRARWVEQELVQRKPRSDGPNLLFVVVDTLRADHLGLYGYHRATSPNLDRLAQQSLVFERAISQSSWTMPAVASLLTGLYPPEHAVRDDQHLESHFRTLADALQGEALTTFAVSANPVVGKQEGFHQGFETYIHLPWARAEHVNTIFRTFLEEKQDLRWFAYLHYIDPHDPYDAPEPHGSFFLEGLQSRFSDKREFTKLWEAVNFGSDVVVFDDVDLEYLRAAYDGEIRYWDNQFGELLETMREMGLLEDTVIVVTSDHGEEFLEHGKLKHGMQLYDESIWVPLILWAPGRLHPERRAVQIETRGLIHAALDLMEAEGAPEAAFLAAGVEGRPYPAFSHTTHALLPGQPGRCAMASVRDTTWKHISYVGSENSELYNVRLDPLEKLDRAAEDPALLAKYSELLERWLAKTKPLVSEEVEASEETVEKLRALGYIK